MPGWDIHNEWAEKLGIPVEVSDFVNLLIDCPQKCQEFLDFCEGDPDARVYKRGKPTRMTICPEIRHNSARSNRIVREIQLKFLRPKGEYYIQAFYLHHIIDYLKKLIIELGLSESIGHILQPKKLEKYIGPLQDWHLRKVRDFVINHSDEIRGDLRD